MKKTKLKQINMVHYLPVAYEEKEQIIRSESIMLFHENGKAEEERIITYYPEYKALSNRFKYDDDWQKVDYDYRNCEFMISDNSCLEDVVPDEIPGVSSPPESPVPNKAKGIRITESPLDKGGKRVISDWLVGEEDTVMYESIVDYNSRGDVISEMEKLSDSDIMIMRAWYEATYNENNNLIRHVKYSEPEKLKYVQTMSFEYF